MPDVGLFTAAEPVSASTPIIVKFSVEVGGLPVYQESYDVEKLREDLELNKSEAETLWLRRLRCVVAARDKAGFSAALTSCLVHGSCSSLGTEGSDTQQLDTMGVPCAKTQV